MQHPVEASIRRYGVPRDGTTLDTRPESAPSRSAVLQNPHSGTFRDIPQARRGRDRRRGTPRKDRDVKSVVVTLGVTSRSGALTFDAFSAARATNP